ncbi:MAG: patatin-like phospholipase family protein [Anaerolineaceae bacterium]|nr:patatin-like phospholipase family protein [Anaerolineaceae bacterium]
MMNDLEMNLDNTVKLGLVLSGGGARGLAHIGVLKALENAGIQPQFLAGSSMGGVVAAGYAAGLSPSDLEKIALEFPSAHSIWKLADPTLPRKGLFQGERLLAFFERKLHGCSFADLRYPLILTAVDLNTGQEVHMQEGSVAEAVRATISIPGLLTPVERDGQRLVDGGLLNNLPVDIVKEMGADITLAVDVAAANANTSYWQELRQKRVLSATIGDFVAVLGDSLTLLIHQQNEYKFRETPPDFLIQPAIPKDVTVTTGFHRAGELIELGYVAADEVVPDLADKLGMACASAI